MIMTVHEWVAGLGIRYGSMRQEDAELKVAEYVRGLTDGSLPQDAFNDTTLELISREYPDRFPTYGQVRKFLEKWWASNKPTPQLMASEVMHSGLTTEQQIQATYWFKHKASGFKHLDDKFPDMEARQAQSLSVLRQYNEVVFRYVCNTDPDAAAIAVRRGWRVNPEPPVTEEERAASLARAREVTSAIGKPGPDYAAIDAQKAAAEKVSREAQVARDLKPKAHHLQGEALRRFREAGNIPVPLVAKDETQPNPKPEAERQQPDLGDPIPKSDPENPNLGPCLTCKGSGKTIAFVDYTDPKTRRRRGERMEIECLDCHGTGRAVVAANDELWTPDWEDADA